MAVTHQKIVSFKSAFAERVFADAFGALTSVNGRLSGFDPAAVGGSAGTPGIIISGQKIYFSVNLSPLSSDDGTVPSAVSSTAIANGVILKTTGVVLVNAAYTSTGTPASEVLNSDDPFYIYVTFNDNSDQDPVFGVDKLSALSASPYQRAKLAYFDPASLRWLRSPSVSMKSVYDLAVAAITVRGGYAVSISDAHLASAAIAVGAGSITGSRNRIVSLGSRLISYVDNMPASTLYRRDLVVLVDPLTEDTATLPQIQVINGGYLTSTLSDPLLKTPPRPTSALQVPLASVLVLGGSTNAAIVSITDMRPDFVWQTDALSASKPVTSAQPEIRSVQPGVVMEDTTLANRVDWFSGIFRSRVVGDDVFVVGRAGDVMTQIFPAASGALGAPTSYTVTSTDFPVAPYILRSSVKIEDITAGTAIDITADNNFSYTIDYLNGAFSGTINWVSSPGGSRIIRVTYKQISALLSISSAGQVNIGELALLRYHLLASNSSAHTASNILYDNTNAAISTLPAEAVSVQSAISRIASGGSSSGGGGGTTTGKTRRIYHFGRNRFAANPANEHPLLMGLSAAAQDSTGVISTVGVGPFYVMPRSGRIKSMTLSAYGATTVAWGAATTAVLTVYVAGGLVASTQPSTILTEGTRAVIAAFEDTLTPTISVGAGVRLAAAIKFDFSVTPIVTDDHGVIATVEIEDD